MKLLINGIEKEFNDLWEARWYIEDEVDVTEYYIEDMVNGCYPKVEIMGLEIEPFEVLQKCAEWKIDDLIDEEKDYIIDEIMSEIELTDEGHIDRFDYFIDIEVIENE